MNCDKHPDKESVASCAVCGKNVCDECLIEIAGNSYCKDCVNELVTESILKNNKEKVDNAKEVTDNVNDKSTSNEDTVEEKDDSNTYKFRSVSNVSDILDENVEEVDDSEEYIIKPVNSVAGGISTGEYIEELEEENVTYEDDELASYTPQNPGDLSEESFNNLNESPDEELEAKYEKYLEDLYYDENSENEEPTPNTDKSTILNKKEDISPSTEELESLKEPNLQTQEEIEIQPTQEPIPQTLQPKEETELQPTQEPIPQTLQPKEETESRIKPPLQTIKEPIYTNYTEEEEYGIPKPRQKTPLSAEEELVKLQKKEEDVIVPAHMQNREDNGLSYEEIRARIRATELNEGDTFQTRFREQERIYEQDLGNRNLQKYEEDLYTSQQIEEEFSPYNTPSPRDFKRPPQVHGSIDDYEKPKSEDGGFTKGEIVLSIILIILIIIVMSYVIYLFTLSTDYPSYLDAVKVLFSNPAQLFENILN